MKSLQGIHYAFLLDLLHTLLKFNLLCVSQNKESLPNDYENIYCSFWKQIIFIFPGIYCENGAEEVQDENPQLYTVYMLF